MEVVVAYFSVQRLVSPKFSHPAVGRGANQRETFYFDTVPKRLKSISETSVGLRQAARRTSAKC
jgi:hypothetical protein